MDQLAFGHLTRDTRSDWVRMRTLILLRWIAIAGQLATISVADRVLKLALPVGFCYLVVGAAVIANLIAVFIFPETKRLSEAEALLTLLFDVAQLAFLLFLTGGLNNPFALLILAPVTISALALELRTTVILGGAAIGMVSLLAWFHVPLRQADGAELAVPPLFGQGFWLAIVIGIVFLATYSRRVATEIRGMSDALLATQMALAREQKLTDLGGVVAAAAHELGTPLATITLVSSELAEELADRPDLAEDARLIRSQADRCRDILRGMGRAGKDDTHLRRAPLQAVLREAAEPHLNRGKQVLFHLEGMDGDARQPLIHRHPEVIHGLRNLMQNAVDFARSRVWIDGVWTGSRISVRIIDDGPGYPPHVLGRIGDPFVRSRADEDPAAAPRPGYEGMGLGLFIAKTLLERSGAELSFANGGDPFLSGSEHPERSGAIVEVIWPRDRIEVQPDSPLARNAPIAAT
ncbi:MAG: ActS/PrrB/RegB family redox-sensitive histidine kinase [Rhodobacterales bacterium]|nr:ActS/PrrB/RegB family redox-sensitive histidine kinase [Rhodobacterales bacterium]